MRGQTILQIDAGKRGRELTEIGGRCADLAGELTEAPVRRRDGRVRAGQDQGEAFGIGAARLDMDQRGFDHAGPASLGSAAHGARQIVERQIALVGGAGEPFGRDATDPLAAADIDLVTTAHVTAGIENLHVHGIKLHDGRREPLSRHATRHGNPVHSLTLGGRCGVSPQKGSAETLARPQGKAFPFRTPSREATMRARRRAPCGQVCEAPAE